MGKTFIIAEAGSSWVTPDGAWDVSSAARLIDAAAACGANAVKFQWTSDGEKMASRRGLGPEAAAMYKKYLQWPEHLLEVFKVRAEGVGLEFMCTTYLIEDIATIAPLVKRFKVSAFEAGWDEFVEAHYEHERPVIVSVNYGKDIEENFEECDGDVSVLLCTSKYPTKIEDLHLSRLSPDECRGMQGKYVHQFFHGLSDHTTSTHTGMMAVSCGASIIEKHIRLSDTSVDNPDYGHSLCCDSAGTPEESEKPPFRQYVELIRLAERAL